MAEKGRGICMRLFTNIEFYNTPEGDVMIKELNKAARPFQENDRELISEMLVLIRDRYPEAHKELMQLYSTSTMNRWHYEYKVVHRFIRCNFGEYDQYNLDIDNNGRFTFEEVRCPLRGECPLETVVCKPQLNTKLTEREMDVFRLIAESNMQTEGIAQELNISPCTVNRHRENIKVKIGVNTIAEMVSYWNHYQMK